jgi:3-methyladenine DNA glycosylase AlkD
MNKLHQQILEEIKKKSSNKSKYKDTATYHGSTHMIYPITVPEVRTIAKEFVKENPDLTFKELENLLEELFKGESYTEKTFAPKLLEYYPKLRYKVAPASLDGWLNFLFGWAEIDSLCQSVFSAKELLRNWEEWEKLIKGFSMDKNISKRRASLVLLTGPVYQSDDKRLSVLAFKNIDLLKPEKDILITKAISWILRSLTKYHKEEVGVYLNKNLKTLPKIAIRETSRKLETGKK